MINLKALATAIIRAWPEGEDGLGFEYAGTDTERCRSRANLFTLYIQALQSRGMDSRLADADIAQLHDVADALEAESDWQFAKFQRRLLADVNRLATKELTEGTND